MKIVPSTIKMGYIVISGEDCFSIKCNSKLFNSMHFKCIRKLMIYDKFSKMIIRTSYMTSEHVVLALSIIHSLDFITTRHLYFRVSLSIVCYVLLYVRTRKVWRYQKDNHTGTVNRKKENLMTKRKQTIGQTMINKIFSYIVAVSVVLVEKPEYPETTTDLQQINDKL